MTVTDQPRPQPSGEGHQPDLARLVIKPRDQQGGIAFPDLGQQVQLLVVQGLLVKRAKIARHHPVAQPIFVGEVMGGRQLALLFPTLHQGVHHRVVGSPLGG